MCDICSLKARTSSHRSNMPRFAREGEDDRGRPLINSLQNKRGPPTCMYTYLYRLHIYTYIKAVQGTEQNRRGGMTSEQTKLLRTGTAITANQTRPDQTGPAVAWSGTDQLYVEWLRIWTGPDWTRPECTGSDWTGPDRTRPNRTGPNWAEATRSAAVWRGMDEFYVGDLDQTGPSRTGLDRNGPDRTGPGPTSCGMERNGTVSFQAKGGAEVQTRFTGGPAEDRA